MNKRILALATAGLSLVSGVALATQPTITHTPIEGEFISQECGFDVRGQVTGTMVDISYIDRQGAFHEFTAFPQLKAVLTNVLTGKRIALNISGPQKITASEDGFSLVFVGVVSWRFDPDLIPAEIPGLFYTKGRFELFVDANGVATVTRTGTKIALCPKLQ